MAVALGERPATAILTGQTDREALIQQGRESQMLRRRPIEPLPFRDGRRPCVNDARKRAVNVNSLWHCGDGLTKRLQAFLGHAGLATALVIIGQAETFPLAVQPVCLLGFECLAGFEFAVEIGFEIDDLLFDLLSRQNAFLDEAFRIDLTGRGMTFDLGVHHRLGEHGLVALIVPKATIAEHVDDNVLAEFLAVLGRDLGRIGDRFRIIPIDVEDRCLNHQSDIRRVRRRPRIDRACRKADLVVHDEVDRPACAIARQARQCETFRHDALPRKGGVAVQQQWQHSRAVQRPALTMQHFLLGARLAQHNRIHRFQVGRVGVHREVNFIAVELAVRRRAEMVFHIARAKLARALRVTALEFVEDLLVGLAHHSGQHVEATTVRHADNDLAHAKRAAALDDLLQRRHRRFTAIKAKALRAWIPFVQEAFEGFRFDQLGENRLLALIRERNALVRAFDPLLKPGLLFRIGNMHELDADGRTIGPLQDVEHLADRRMVQTKIAIDEDLAAHVFCTEAIAGRVQFRLFFGRVERKRVQLGGQVAAHAVGPDHHDRADRILDVLRDFLGRGARLGRFQLFLELWLDQRPVAIKGGNLFVGKRTGPVAPFPAGAPGIARGVARIIAQFCKEFAPALGN